MNPILLGAIVAGAGGLGAVGRYLLDGAVGDRLSGTFPHGTLVVNLVGSFILGLATGLALHHGLPSAWRRAVGVGFCGGLTTWSSASFETVRLLEEREYTVAAQYTVCSLGGCLLAAAAGLALALI